jgi:nucleotide-binding universal stress UspA family protein
MSYKTILVHVDESSTLESRVAIAAQIARDENAHLVGVAVTGVSRYVYEALGATPDDPRMLPYVDLLLDRADRAMKKFESLARRSGGLSFESQLVNDEPTAGITLQARHADLTIIQQYDPNEPSPAVMFNFPEYVVINGGCPVLIVPYTGYAASTGRNALVGWNASAEAARALRGALPLLKRAERVRLAIFNPEQQPDLVGDPPGTATIRYLARHQVQAELITRSTDGDIGEALLSLAADLGADLLVMGCYGHSRFREILLSGATRTVLLKATLPVLMAH